MKVHLSTPDPSLSSIHQVSGGLKQYRYLIRDSNLFVGVGVGGGGYAKSAIWIHSPISTHLFLSLQPSDFFLFLSQQKRLSSVWQDVKLKVQFSFLWWG